MFSGNTGKSFQRKQGLFVPPQNTNMLKATSRIVVPESSKMLMELASPVNGFADVVPVASINQKTVSLSRIPPLALRIVR